MTTSMLSNMVLWRNSETGEENDYEGEDFDGMFRFEKRMKP